MQKLYIVRHGKTGWNVQGLMQGSIDISLNEEGIKQAKETAELIVGNKKNIIYDELLLERGFGDYEGQKVNLEIIFIVC